MTSNGLRIRQLQRRLAVLLDRLPSKKAAVGDQSQMTPSGWKLTWNPARPTIINIDDEENGTWSDSALRYPTGKIVYDAPEKIPSDVKKAVQSLFAKARRTASTPKTREAASIWKAKPITFDQVREAADRRWAPRPGRYLPISSSPNLSTWTMGSDIIDDFIFEMAGDFYFSSWNQNQSKALEKLVIQELTGAGEDSKKIPIMARNATLSVFSSQAGSSYPSRYWGDYAIRELGEMRGAFKTRFPALTSIVAWFDQHIHAVNTIREGTERMVETAVTAGLKKLGLDDPANYMEKRT